MGLAALGNVMLLSVVFVLAQQLFGVDWSASIRTLHAFALPAYSPILLLVTLIMNVRDRPATSEVEAECTAQANRTVVDAVANVHSKLLFMPVRMISGSMAPDDTCPAQGRRDHSPGRSLSRLIQLVPTS